MRKLFSQKTIATCLSVILFLTNTVLAHTPESNFWEHRKQAVQSQNPATDKQIAALPAPLSPNTEQLIQRLPSAIKSPLANSYSRALALSPGLAPMMAALPVSLGTVRKVLPRHNGKTIIHIQDVHANAEAQLNIGQAVSKLVATKKVGLVALEGDSSVINLEASRQFPSQLAVQKTADYLLKSNKISGPIHAALIAPDNMPTFIGVDDKTHYDANVSAYLSSRALQQRASDDLKKAASALAAAKLKTFSPALALFDRHVEAFAKGDESMGEYARYLSSTKSDLPLDVQAFLEAYDIEAHLDFKAVETERTALITSFVTKLKPQDVNELLSWSVAYRSGEVGHTEFYRYLKNLCERNGVSMARYRNMDRYIQYVLLSESINAEKLFSTLRDLETETYAQLATTDAEKSLVNQSRRLRLEGKLIEFGLSMTEWKEYRQMQMREGVSQLSATELKPFESFYLEAEARDRAMTQSLLKAMAERHADVAVLVTGGFHSDGMDARLNEAGMTVVSFSPRLTKVENENGSSYLGVFAQEKTPLEKLFQGEKLFLAQPPSLGMSSGEGPVLETGVAKAINPEFDAENLFKAAAPAADRSKFSVAVERFKNGVVVVVNSVRTKIGLDAQFNITSVEEKSAWSFAALRTGLRSFFAGKPFTATKTVEKETKEGTLRIRAPTAFHIALAALVITTLWLTLPVVADLLGAMIPPLPKEMVGFTTAALKVAGISSVAGMASKAGNAFMYLISLAIAYKVLADSPLMRRLAAPGTLLGRIAAKISAVVVAFENHSKESKSKPWIERIHLIPLHIPLTIAKTFKGFGLDPIFRIYAVYQGEKVERPNWTEKFYARMSSHSAWQFVLLPVFASASFFEGRIRTLLTQQKGRYLVWVGVLGGAAVLGAILQANSAHLASSFLDINTIQIFFEAFGYGDTFQRWSHLDGRWGSFVGLVLSAGKMMMVLTTISVATIRFSGELARLIRENENLTWAQRWKKVTRGFFRSSTVQMKVEDPVTKQKKFLAVTRAPGWIAVIAAFGLEGTHWVNAEVQLGIDASHASAITEYTVDKIDGPNDSVLSAGDVVQKALAPMGIHFEDLPIVLPGSHHLNEHEILALNDLQKNLATNPKDSPEWKSANAMYRQIMLKQDPDYVLKQVDEKLRTQIENKANLDVNQMRRIAPLLVDAPAIAAMLEKNPELAKKIIESLEKNDAEKQKKLDALKLRDSNAALTAAAAHGKNTHSSKSMAGGAGGGGDDVPPFLRQRFSAFGFVSPSLLTPQSEANTLVDPFRLASGLDWAASEIKSPGGDLDRLARTFNFSLAEHAQNFFSPRYQKMMLDGAEVRATEASRPELQPGLAAEREVAVNKLLAQKDGPKAIVVRMDKDHRWETSQVINDFLQIQKWDEQGRIKIYENLPLGVESPTGHGREILNAGEFEEKDIDFQVWVTDEHGRNERRIVFGDAMAEYQIAVAKAYQHGREVLNEAMARASDPTKKFLYNPATNLKDVEKAMAKEGPQKVEGVADPNNDHVIPQIVFGAVLSRNQYKQPEAILNYFDHGQIEQTNSANDPQKLPRLALPGLKGADGLPPELGFYENGKHGTLTEIQNLRAKTADLIVLKHVKNGKLLDPIQDKEAYNDPWQWDFLTFGANAAKFQLTDALMGLFQHHIEMNNSRRFQKTLREGLFVEIASLIAGPASPFVNPALRLSFQGWQLTMDRLPEAATDDKFHKFSHDYFSEKTLADAIENSDNFILATLGLDETATRAMAVKYMTKNGKPPPPEDVDKFMATLYSPVDNQTAANLLANYQVARDGKFDSEKVSDMLRFVHSDPDLTKVMKLSKARRLDGIIMWSATTIDIGVRAWDTTEYELNKSKYQTITVPREPRVIEVLQTPFGPVTVYETIDPNHPPTTTIAGKKFIEHAPKWVTFFGQLTLADLSPVSVTMNPIPYLLQMAHRDPAAQANLVFENGIVRGNLFQLRVYGVPVNVLGQMGTVKQWIKTEKAYAVKVDRANFFNNFFGFRLNKPGKEKSGPLVELKLDKFEELTEKQVDEMDLIPRGVVTRTETNEETGKKEKVKSRFFWWEDRVTHQIVLMREEGLRKNADKLNKKLNDYYAYQELMLKGGYMDKTLLDPGHRFQADAKDSAGSVSVEDFYKATVNSEHPNTKLAPSYIYEHREGGSEADRTYAYSLANSARLKLIAGDREGAKADLRYAARNEWARIGVDESSTEAQKPGRAKSFFKKIANSLNPFGEPKDKAQPKGMMNAIEASSEKGQPAESVVNAGPNADLLIASLQVLSPEFKDGELPFSVNGLNEFQKTGKLSDVRKIYSRPDLIGRMKSADPELYEAALRYGDFLLLLQDKDGSIRHGATAADRAIASTEENIRTYAAFMMLFEATGQSKYADAADRILAWLPTVYDKSRGIFYEGVSGGVVTKNFVTDVNALAVTHILPEVLERAVGSDGTPLFNARGTAAALVDSLELAKVTVETNVNGLPVEVTAYDGTDEAGQRKIGRAPLVMPEWSAHVASAHQSYARYMERIHVPVDAVEVERNIATQILNQIDKLAVRTEAGVFLPASTMPGAQLYPDAHYTMPKAWSLDANSWTAFVAGDFQPGMLGAVKSIAPRAPPAPLTAEQYEQARAALYQHLENPATRQTIGETDFHVGADELKSAKSHYSDLVSKKNLNQEALINRWSNEYGGYTYLDRGTGLSHDITIMASMKEMQDRLDRMQKQRDRQQDYLKVLENGGAIVLNEDGSFSEMKIGKEAVKEQLDYIANHFSYEDQFKIGEVNHWTFMRDGKKVIVKFKTGEPVTQTLVNPRTNEKERNTYVNGLLTQSERLMTENGKEFPLTTTINTYNKYNIKLSARTINNLTGKELQSSRYVTSFFPENEFGTEDRAGRETVEETTFNDSGAKQLETYGIFPAPIAIESPARYTSIGYDRLTGRESRSMTVDKSNGHVISNSISEYDAAKKAMRKVAINWRNHDARKAANRVTEVWIEATPESPGRKLRQVIVEDGQETRTENYGEDVFNRISAKWLAGRVRVFVDNNLTELRTIARAADKTPNIDPNNGRATFIIDRVRPILTGYSAIADLLRQRSRRLDVVGLATGIAAGLMDRNKDANVEVIRRTIDVSETDGQLYSREEPARWEAAPGVVKLGKNERHYYRVDEARHILNETAESALLPFKTVHADDRRPQNDGTVGAPFVVYDVQHDPIADHVMNNLVITELNLEADHPGDPRFQVPLPAPAQKLATQYQVRPDFHPFWSISRSSLKASFVKGPWHDDYATVRVDETEDPTGLMQFTYEPLATSNNSTADGRELSRRFYGKSQDGRFFMPSNNAGSVRLTEMPLSPITSRVVPSAPGELRFSRSAPVKTVAPNGETTFTPGAVQGPLQNALWAYQGHYEKPVDLTRGTLEITLQRRSGAVERRYENIFDVPVKVESHLASGRARMTAEMLDYAWEPKYRHFMSVKTELYQDGELSEALNLSRIADGTPEIEPATGRTFYGSTLFAKTDATYGPPVSYRNYALAFEWDGTPSVEAYADAKLRLNWDVTKIRDVNALGGEQPILPFDAFEFTPGRNPNPDEKVANYTTDVFIDSNGKVSRLDVDRRHLRNASVIDLKNPQAPARVVDTGTWTKTSYGVAPEDAEDPFGRFIGDLRPVTEISGGIRNGADRPMYETDFFYSNDQNLPATLVASRQKAGVNDSGRPTEIGRVRYDLAADGRAIHMSDFVNLGLDRITIGNSQILSLKAAEYPSSNGPVFHWYDRLGRSLQDKKFDAYAYSKDFKFDLTSFNWVPGNGEIWDRKPAGFRLNEVPQGAWIQSQLMHRENEGIETTAFFPDVDRELVLAQVKNSPPSDIGDENFESFQTFADAAGRPWLRTQNYGKDVPVQRVTFHPQFDGHNPHALDANGNLPKAWTQPVAASESPDFLYFFAQGAQADNIVVDVIDGQGKVIDALKFNASAPNDSGMISPLLSDPIVYRNGKGRLKVVDVQPLMGQIPLFPVGNNPRPYVIPMSPLLEKISRRGLSLNAVTFHVRSADGSTLNGLNVTPLERLSDPQHNSEWKYSAKERAKLFPTGKENPKIEQLKPGVIDNRNGFVTVIKGHGTSQEFNVYQNGLLLSKTFWVRNGDAFDQVRVHFSPTLSPYVRIPSHMESAFAGWLTLVSTTYQVKGGRFQINVANVDQAVMVKYFPSTMVNVNNPIINYLPWGLFNPDADFPNVNANIANAVLRQIAESYRFRIDPTLKIFPAPQDMEIVNQLSPQSVHDLVNNTPRNIPYDVDSLPVPQAVAKPAAPLGDLTHFAQAVSAEVNRNVSTHLPVTALGTTKEKYADTAGVADIMRALVESRDPSALDAAKKIADFYITESKSGRTALGSQYHVDSGAPMQFTEEFRQPNRSIQVASANVEMARAMLQLARSTGEAKYWAMAVKLTERVLDFVPENDFLVSFNDEPKNTPEATARRLVAVWHRMGLHEEQSRALATLNRARQQLKANPTQRARIEQEMKRELAVTLHLSSAEEIRQLDQLIRPFETESDQSLARTMIRFWESYYSAEEREKISKEEGLVALRIAIARDRLNRRPETVTEERVKFENSLRQIFKATSEHDRRSLHDILNIAGGISEYLPRSPIHSLVLGITLSPEPDNYDLNTNKEALLLFREMAEALNSNPNAYSWESSFRKEVLVSQRNLENFFRQNVFGDSLASAHLRQQLWVTGITPTGTEGKEQPYIIVADKWPPLRNAIAVDEAFLLLEPTQTDTVRKWLDTQLKVFGDRTVVEDPQTKQPVAFSGMDYVPVTFGRPQGRMFSSELTARFGLVARQAGAPVAEQFARDSMPGFMASNPLTGQNGVREVSGVSPVGIDPFWGIATGDGRSVYPVTGQSAFPFSRQSFIAADQFLNGRAPAVFNATQIETARAQAEKLISGVPLSDRVNIFMKQAKHSSVALSGLFVGMISILIHWAWSKLSNRKVEPTKGWMVVDFLLMVGLPVGIIFFFLGFSVFGGCAAVVWAYGSYQVVHSRHSARRAEKYLEKMNARLEELKAHPERRIYSDALIRAANARYHKRVLGDFLITDEQGNKTDIIGSDALSEFEANKSIGTAETQFLEGLRYIHFLTMEYYRRVHHLDEYDKDVWNRLAATDVLSIHEPNSVAPANDSPALVELDQYVRRVGEWFRRELTAGVHDPALVDTTVYGKSMFYFQHQAEVLRQILIKMPEDPATTDASVKQFQKVLDEIGLKTPASTFREKIKSDVDRFAEDNQLKSIHPYMFEWAHFAPRMLLATATFPFIYSRHSGHTPLHLMASTIQSLNASHPLMVVLGVIFVILGIVGLIWSMAKFPVGELRNASKPSTASRVWPMTFLILGIAGVALLTPSLWFLFVAQFSSLGMNGWTGAMNLTSMLLPLTLIIIFLAEIVGLRANRISLARLTLRKQFGKPAMMASARAVMLYLGQYFLFIALTWWIGSYTASYFENYLSGASIPWRVASLGMSWANHGAAIGLFAVVVGLLVVTMAKLKPYAPKDTSLSKEAQELSLAEQARQRSRIVMAVTVLVSIVVLVVLDLARPLAGFFVGGAVLYLSLTLAHAAINNFVIGVASFTRELGRTRNLVELGITILVFYGLSHVVGSGGAQLFFTYAYKSMGLLFLMSLGHPKLSTPILGTGIIGFAAPIWWGDVYFKIAFYALILTAGYARWWVRRLRRADERVDLAHIDVEAIPDQSIVVVVTGGQASASAGLLANSVSKATDEFMNFWNNVVIPYSVPSRLVALVGRPATSDEVRNALQFLFAKEEEMQTSLFDENEIYVEGTPAGTPEREEQLRLLRVKEPGFAPKGLLFTVRDDNEAQLLREGLRIRRHIVSLSGAGGGGFGGSQQDTAQYLTQQAEIIKFAKLNKKVVFAVQANQYEASAPAPDELLKLRPNENPDNARKRWVEYRQRLALTRYVTISTGIKCEVTYNSTHSGMKSGAQFGNSGIFEHMRVMDIVDRNTNAYDLKAKLKDLCRFALNPNLTVVFPLRSTSNAITAMGRVSKKGEFGFSMYEKSLVQDLGGNFAEMISIGFGTTVRSPVNDLITAFSDPEYRYRFDPGASSDDHAFGGLPAPFNFPHQSEDYIQSLVFAEAFKGLGIRPEMAVSETFYHKLREFSEMLEMVAARPRWSGGGDVGQGGFDPYIQRVTQLGSNSIMMAEIQRNRARYYLMAPLAMLNIVVTPVLILTGYMPFAGILLLFWAVGIVANQVLTLNGLAMYIKESGFWKGMSHWISERFQDTIIFAPLVFIELYGVMDAWWKGKQFSFSFGLSAAGDLQKKKRNMWEDILAKNGAPRIFRWMFATGFVATMLNLYAISRLDMLNAMMLYPTLIFSAGIMLGSYIYHNRKGPGPSFLNWKIWVPKIIGVFYSALILIGISFGAGTWLANPVLRLFVLATSFGLLIALFPAKQFVVPLPHNGPAVPEGQSKLKLRTSVGILGTFQSYKDEDEKKNVQLQTYRQDERVIHNALLEEFWAALSIGIFLYFFQHFGFSLSGAITGIAMAIVPIAKTYRLIREPKRLPEPEKVDPSAPKPAPKTPEQLREDAKKKDRQEFKEYTWETIRTSAILGVIAFAWFVVVPSPALATARILEYNLTLNYEQILYLIKYLSAAIGFIFLFGQIHDVVARRYNDVKYRYLIQRYDQLLRKVNEPIEFEKKWEKLADATFHRINSLFERVDAKKYRNMALYARSRYLPLRIFNWVDKIITDLSNFAISRKHNAEYRHPKDPSKINVLPVSQALVNSLNQSYLLNIGAPNTASDVLREIRNVLNNLDDPGRYLDLRYLTDGPRTPKRPRGGQGPRAPTTPKTPSAPVNTSTPPVAPKPSNTAVMSAYELREVVQTLYGTPLNLELSTFGQNVQNLSDHIDAFRNTGHQLDESNEIVKWIKNLSHEQIRLWLMQELKQKVKATDAATLIAETQVDDRQLNVLVIDGSESTESLAKFSQLLRQQSAGQKTVVVYKDRKDLKVIESLGKIKAIKMPRNLVRMVENVPTLDLAVLDRTIAGESSTASAVRIVTGENVVFDPSRLGPDSALRMALFLLLNDAAGFETSFGSLEQIDKIARAIKQQA